jgi:hypothetical protein
MGIVTRDGHCIPKDGCGVVGRWESPSSEETGMMRVGNETMSFRVQVQGYETRYTSNILHGSCFKHRSSFNSETLPNHKNVIPTVTVNVSRGPIVPGLLHICQRLVTARPPLSNLDNFLRQTWVPDWLQIAIYGTCLLSQILQVMIRPRLIDEFERSASLVRVKSVFRIYIRIPVIIASQTTRNAPMGGCWTYGPLHPSL